jgi:hypothetical protein
MDNPNDLDLLMDRGSKVGADRELMLKRSIKVSVTIAGAGYETAAFSPTCPSGNLPASARRMFSA